MYYTQGKNLIKKIIKQKNKKYKTDNEYIADATAHAFDDRLSALAPPPK